ncbi:MAG: type II secretion system F family protein, partial [Pseudomonadota bacterium]
TPLSGGGRGVSFHYVASSSDGRTVKGVLDASDRQGALQALKAKRLAPISLKERVGRRGASGLSFTPKEHLPASAHARIARALADLLGAGVPLRDALALCAKRERSAKAAQFIERIEARVRGGEPLSKAIAEDRAEAPRLMIAMIRAAEQTGAFAPVLTKLADTLEASDKLRRETIAQLIYPSLLFVLVLLTIGFLSFYVLPQFERVFTSAAAEPPALTRAALAGGAWVRDHGWTTPFIVILGVIAVRMIAGAYKPAVHRLALSAPGLGGLLRTVEVGRFCRSLGTLTASGTPLAAAFPVALNVVGNTHAQGRLATATERVRGGEALADALHHTRIAPTAVVSLIEIGERTGQLGDMTLKAADLCAEDARKVLSTGASIISPVMTVLMGALVAGVVAAVMVGVLSLNDAVY